MASVFLDDVFAPHVARHAAAVGRRLRPEWGLFAAGSLVLSLPIVIQFFFVQKQMVSGVTAGAVKG